MVRLLVLLSVLCGFLHAEKPLTYDVWSTQAAKQIFSNDLLSDVVEEKQDWIIQRMQSIAEDEAQKQALHPALAFVEALLISQDRAAQTVYFDIINNYYASPAGESLLFQITGFRWGTQVAEGRNALAYQRGRAWAAAQNIDVDAKFQIPGLQEAMQYPLVKSWAQFFATEGCDPDWMWDNAETFYGEKNVVEGFDLYEATQQKAICRALDSIAPQWAYFYAQYDWTDLAQALIRTAVKLKSTQAMNTLGIRLLTEEADCEQIQRGINLLVQSQKGGDLFAPLNLGRRLLMNKTVQDQYSKMFPGPDPIVLSVNWLCQSDFDQDKDLVRYHLIQNTPGVRDSRLAWLKEHKLDVWKLKESDPITWGCVFFLTNHYSDCEFGWRIILNKDALRTAMSSVLGIEEGKIIRDGVEWFDENVDLMHLLLDTDSIEEECSLADKKWENPVNNLMIGACLKNESCIKMLKAFKEGKLSEILGYFKSDYDRQELLKHLVKILRSHR